MTYIFRLPRAAHTFPFTFENLRTLAQGPESHRETVLGTTVTLSIPGDDYDTVHVYLYDTLIASFRQEGTVYIPLHVNAHMSQATRGWLEVLTRRYVYSAARRYNVAGQILPVIPLPDHGAVAGSSTVVHPPSTAPQPISEDTP